MSIPWKWWHKAVFYQIYPRSFADFFDGKESAPGSDGVGDLPGIIARLDYLKDLGIDAIWLSPHYPSPLVDVGYDISDYTGVAPEYGSMDDFIRFLEAAHRREIRVITDLVLNHTSDQHAWFQESRSGRNNPKSDWFIWKDGKNGGPPNNWLSSFGGSAWEYAPERDQYYYHFFFREQPDLNWRNPRVKGAMFDLARFWLDLGVDGFRLDAIGTLFEDLKMRDHEARMTQAELYRARGSAHPAEKRLINQQWRLMFKQQVDQPEIPGLLRELRAVIDEYDDRVLVGETEELAYCGDDMLHLVFNFPLMRTRRLTPARIRNNQAIRLKGLTAIDCPAPGAWPCNTLGNHDSPRLMNRFGDGVNDAALARVWLALMLTLRGTPFLYYGEEVGMTDLMLRDLALFRDTLGIWFYQLYISVLDFLPQEALDLAARHTRDKNRTPMQWANAPHAGFCTAGAQPWLPVNPNYADGVNVDDQQNNPASLLNFYKRILHFRRETPALALGDYRPLHEKSTGYLAFLRRYEDQSCLVALNMSEKSLMIDFSDAIPLIEPAGPAQPHILFSSRDHPSQTISLAQVDLSPFEVLVMEL